MAQPRFALLPTKALVDLDNVAYVIQAELNKYVVVPKQTVSPQIPVMDGTDFDAFVEALAGQGLLVKVVRPAAANDPKVEVATR